jgi:low affinity Fe/Cu permease
MVFLIQNSQNRDAKATQLKLDEIIRAVGGARNELLNLENLSEEDLKELEHQFKRIRKKAELDGDSNGIAPAERESVVETVKLLGPESRKGTS